MRHIIPVEPGQCPVPPTALTRNGEVKVTGIELLSSQRRAALMISPVHSRGISNSYIEMPMQVGVALAKAILKMASIPENSEEPTLSDKDLEQQDLVDNAIHQLLTLLMQACCKEVGVTPPQDDRIWAAEDVGEVRDAIASVFERRGINNYYFYPGFDL